MRWPEPDVELPDEWQIGYSPVRLDDFGQQWTLRFYVVPVLPSPLAG